MCCFRDLANSLDLIYPEFVAKLNKEYSANQRKPVAWSHMSYSKMRANSLKTQYELEKSRDTESLTDQNISTYYGNYTLIKNLNGSIIKTTTGGFGPNQWASQTANQKDYFPIGGETNVWITEAYNGTIFQYEQAVLVLKHTPLTITWTGVDTLITTWPVGSVQSALDARYIFFETPAGRKQITIKSAKLSIINEVEYTLDQ